MKHMSVFLDVKRFQLIGSNSKFPVNHTIKGKFEIIVNWKHVKEERIENIIKKVNDLMFIHKRYPPMIKDISFSKFHSFL